MPSEVFPLDTDINISILEQVVTRTSEKGVMGEEICKRELTGAGQTVTDIWTPMVKM